MTVLKYRDPASGAYILLSTGRQGERGPTGPPGSIPTGMIVIWPGPSGTIPAGFLYCNGALIARASYPELLVAIGTYWGAGDGVNTFALPDGRDRVLIGVSGTKALGAYGGSADLAIPIHNHTVRGATQTTDWANTGHLHSGSGTTGGQNANHSHGVNVQWDVNQIGGAGAQVRVRDVGGANGQAGQGAGTGSTGTEGGPTPSHAHGFSVSISDQDRNHYHPLSIDNSGVSATNQNLPPWAAVNYAIKT